MQLYMLIRKTHSVKNRIVSISQPYIRPIVRGKAKSPVEFGAKLDLSVDEIGMCRIEKLSFDAYNESTVLETAIENYKKRTVHYPKRVLAYQDNTDRIDVDRKISLAKRKFGLGLLLTKREDTTKASIVLSIIAMNIDRLAAMLLRFLRFVLNFCLPYLQTV